ncbi:MAG TPA: FAD-dependent oxidoreductase [Chloroflexi bacterium]|nr:FAD-dependent oxidoreductase [Chloroflexota bacterium]
MSARRMAFERHYDVVVVGAGVAGVAAALQCARSGLHTALVEKTILLGGLATTGLVNVFLPLCDGLGHQVIFGIAEELLWASLRYGPGAVPAIWTGDAPRPEIGQPMPRLQATFSPAAFALALDEVVLEAGVEPWLDTLVTHPLLEGDRVVGLQVENKSGRGVLYATCVVDATGDADVAARAGAPCVTGHNWLSLWALEHAHGAGLNMVRLGADAMGRGHPDNHPIYHGVDGRQVTDFVLAGRALLRARYRAQLAEDPEARAHSFPVTLPTMAQFRTTRRVEGRETLQADAVNLPHPHAVGVMPDWRRAGPLREVPYGALVPRQVRGLLVAGRCIAAEGDAWEVARVIPTAASTGQLAGIAASLAVRRGCTPDALSIASVQEAVREHGLPCGMADLGFDAT